MAEQVKALNTSQVARMLGVSRQTIRKWAEDGLIPHRRLLNGQLRYDPAEIERLREQQDAGSAA